jgi:hypothetical protein
MQRQVSLGVHVDKADTFAPRSDSRAKVRNRSGFTNSAFLIYYRQCLHERDYTETAWQLATGKWQLATTKGNDNGTSKPQTGGIARNPPLGSCRSPSPSPVAICQLPVAMSFPRS